MLVSPAELVAIAKATITECSVAEVEQCLASDPILIDIRDRAEYEKGHIPGAVHLSRGMLEFDIHDLVKSFHPESALPCEEQPIVLYCGTGGRSALAAQCLESMGYKNIRSMSGGLVAWAAAQLPVEYPA